MTLLGQRFIDHRVRTGGAYAGGVWVPGSVVTVTPILASVQEATGEVLEMLLEAERKMDPVVVISKSPIATTNQHDGLEADELDIDGATYKVVRVLSRHSLIAHHQVVAIRLKEAG